MGIESFWGSGQAFSLGLMRKDRTTLLKYFESSADTAYESELSARKSLA